MINTGFTKRRLPGLVLRLALPMSLLLSAALLSGCGNDSAEKAEDTGADDSPRMIERSAPQRSADTESELEADADQDTTDFRVVPNLEGKLEQDGMGLEAIIDASSKKAYADSMAWIAEDVSAEQFKSLERSLRYIQAYDSTVMGDEQRFLDTIDGKTGQELINRANRLIQERRR